MTSTVLDHRWSMKRESVYNTPVTTDRFYPWIDGVDADWDPRPRQSMGQQGGNGRRSPLGERRYGTIGQGALKLRAELESKGGGVLLDWALGVSTVTAITGGSQQVFHTGITGTLLPSATVQVVKVLNDGTEQVETYAGCTAGKVTIEQPEDNITMLEVDVDARSYTTATAAATPAYATAPVLFDHFQGACALGGTLTVPTTTALASGLTAYADFRSWKIEIDQSIDKDRRVIGSRNQPLAGTPNIKFSGKAEFNDTTLSAGLVGQTKFPWYQTITTTETLDASFTQLQVVIPQLTLNKGLPQVKPGTTTVQDVDADITSDGTNRDIYVVVRTTDTAL